MKQRAPRRKNVQKLFLDIAYFQLPKNCPYIIHYDEKGRKHRDDGPAVVCDQGGHWEWWQHGKKHREDGPAVISKEGEAYYLENANHRIDGPAVMWWEQNHSPAPTPYPIKRCQWSLFGEMMYFKEWLEKSPCDDEIKTILKLKFFDEKKGR